MTARLLALWLVWLPMGVWGQGIVSLDGAVTEIVHALGAGQRLVGVDRGSQYPSQVQELPSVGYKRNLSAEGVLALGPELVLATDQAGPAAVLAQLRAAGLEVVVVPDEASIDGLAEKIRAVARRLDREAEGKDLIADIRSDLTAGRARLEEDTHRPPVLFLLHVGSGADLSAGAATAPDLLIHLAGAKNVMADAFTGYKPLTAEAAVAAAPAVILVTERNLDTLGGKAGALQRAGLAVTPAGRAGRVAVMEGQLLLSLGPRTGQAVAELARRLHGP